MFRGLRKEYVYMLPVIFTQNWYGCQWAWKYSSKL
jgi:hypothetical protein